MSKLVNLSDEVYEKLTRLKMMKDTSYSQVITGLLSSESRAGMLTIRDMLERAKGRKYLGKRVKVNHDLIAYGVGNARD